MAYKTGTVTTASGLLTEIEDFLINDCEWDLIDTVSSGNNRVYFSNGDSGLENIYVRLQYNLKDYNNTPTSTYFQNQTHVNNSLEHLNATIMQHYDPATNTSTNEVDGRMGPWFLYNGSSTGQTTANLLRVVNTPNRSQISIGTHKNNGSMVNTNTYWFIDVNGTDYHGSNMDFYTDPKKPLGFYSNNPGMEEIFYSDLLRRRFAYDVPSFGFPGIGTRFCFAIDETGAEVFYGLMSNSTSGWGANRFCKINIETGTLTYLNIPPHGSSPGTNNYGNASLCWDGNNSLFIALPNSTIFGKYNIATNTWSTMTAIPVVGNVNYNSQHNLIYINKNSNLGTSLGWTEDRIYWKIPHSTTASASLYYYSVISNTWTLASAGTDTLNMSTTANKGQFMAWDGYDRIYFFPAHNSSFPTISALYNIKTNTWTNPNIAYHVQNAYGGNLFFLNSYLNQMIVDKNLTTYHMFGDLNHFKIALTHNNNKNYFYYFGNIESFYSNQKAVLTSSVSAGSNVLFSVSGVFSQFEIDQPLYIYDPSIDGHAESFNLSSSGIASLTASTLVYNYSAGSIIGVDPQLNVTFMNTLDGVASLHSPFGPGCFTGNNSNPNKFGQQIIYSLVPGNNLTLRSSFKGSRGHYQLNPVLVCSTPSEATEETCSNEQPRDLSTTIQGKTSNVLGKFIEQYNNGTLIETRGQLRGVYATAQTTAPAPVTGDEIAVGSSNYMCFKFENLFGPNGGKNLLTLLGPK